MRQVAMGIEIEERDYGRKEARYWRNWIGPPSGDAVRTTVFLHWDGVEEPSGFEADARARGFRVWRGSLPLKGKATRFVVAAPDSSETAGEVLWRLAVESAGGSIER